MTQDEKAPRPLKEASILVVEDHTFVLDLLERMLTSHVGALHSARSGEDAFYNLEKTPGLAHVAIVDFHLLGMNGLKFIEKLRDAKQPERLRKLPVIMMTGDNDMNLYRSAARLGISAFLVKPVAATPLIEALERALAGRRVAIPRLAVDAPLPTKAKTAPETLRSAPPPPEEAPPEEETPASVHSPIDFKA